jgi:hypothetical protein
MARALAIKHIAVRKKALENGLAFALGACRGVLCVCGGMGEWRTDESGGQREWWSKGVVVGGGGGR